jgi:hypothetical protein
MHGSLARIAVGRLDTVLTGADGTIPAPLRRLRDAFVAVEQPRSTLVWLDRSPGAKTLRSLVTGELPLTHAALAHLDRCPSLGHVRHMLVATGALPDRHEALARLEHHISVAVAATGDPATARLLRSYGTWRVLGRLRRRPTPPPDATIHAARYQFDLAVVFIAWLDEQDLSLDTCCQQHLERWLADGAASRVQIREFLLFAAGRDTSSQLTPPPTQVPRRTTPRHRDPQRRWTDGRRLLHDDQLDVADRVAGALVVLYAQPLTRIAQLRRDDIAEKDGDVFLRLGSEHLHMPEPLGQLLLALPARRQVGPSGHVPSTQQWLFPGQPASRHQKPDHIANRLRTIDIPPRIVRTDALLQLARQVPATGLADLLGLHINTAVRWTKLAGGDWNTYAASRVRALTVADA